MLESSSGSIFDWIERSVSSGSYGWEKRHGQHRLKCRLCISVNKKTFPSVASHSSYLTTWKWWPEFYDGLLREIPTIHSRIHRFPDVVEMVLHTCEMDTFNRIECSTSSSQVWNVLCSPIQIAVQSVHQVTWRWGGLWLAPSSLVVQSPKFLIFLTAELQRLERKWFKLVGDHREWNFLLFH